MQDALAAVTQQAPDYETLMLIQATRRLYQPLRKNLPLPAVIEINRRLLLGYTRYMSEPQVVRLTASVLDYNSKLRALGIKDHQVERTRDRPRWRVLATLAYRLGQLCALGLGTIPSLLLFWPVFATTKVISVRKQRKALAGSVVKLHGRDVVGTWKILVAMGLTPALYVWYTAVTTFWLYLCRRDSHQVAFGWTDARVYVPDFVPLWLFSALIFGLMILVTFAGLLIGEIGMDVMKSLPPLLLDLSPSSTNSMAKLRGQRQVLLSQVSDVIDSFGQELFPDLDMLGNVADHSRSRSGEDLRRRRPLARSESFRGDVHE
jgi:glycerol-3-phosphate O-acyltransferase/dihydroxyacetone phosphate acyltransferase